MKNVIKGLVILLLFILGGEIYAFDIRSNQVSSKSAHEFNHIPYWAASEEERQRNKNIQLCVQWMEPNIPTGLSYKILDRFWKVVSTYHSSYAQDVCPDLYKNRNYGRDQAEDTDDTWEVDDTEDFLDSLFGDAFKTKEPKSLTNNRHKSNSERYFDKKVDNKKWSELKIDSFLDDLFGLDDSASSNSDNKQGNNDDMDKFLDDLFWYWVNNRLDSLEIVKGEEKLPSKQLLKTIRRYTLAKSIVKVWPMKVSISQHTKKYNPKFIAFLEKVDNDFVMDSTKKSLAKSMSNVSYSLSSYLDSEWDRESKKVLKIKLINDLKRLKKKYKVLKNKDIILTRSYFRKSNVALTELQSF